MTIAAVAGHGRRSCFGAVQKDGTRPPERWPMRGKLDGAATPVNAIVAAQQFPPNEESESLPGVEMFRG